MIINLLRFNHTKAPTGTPQSANFENLPDLVANKELILDKSQMPLLLFALSKDGSRRREAITHVTAFVYDWDDDCPGVDFLAAAAKRSHRPVLIYESPSSTKLEPKVRIILPLFAPRRVQGEGLKKQHRALFSDIFGEHNYNRLDKSCDEPNRGYYPAKAGGRVVGHLFPPLPAKGYNHNLVVAFAKDAHIAGMAPDDALDALLAFESRYMTERPIAPRFESRARQLAWYNALNPEPDRPIKNGACHISEQEFRELPPVKPPERSEARVEQIDELLMLTPDWFIQLYGAVFDNLIIKQREFALGAAYFVGAVSAGEKVYLDLFGKQAINAYLLFLGSTGCGKEMPMRCVNYLLKGLGYGPYLMREQASAASLRKALAAQEGFGVYAMRETGTILGRPGPKAEDFRAEFLRLFSEEELKGKDAIGEESKQDFNTIQCPSFSLIGDSTPDTLFTPQVTKMAHASGLTNRFLMFFEDEDLVPERRELKSLSYGPLDTVISMATSGFEPGLESLLYAEQHGLKTEVGFEPRARSALADQEYELRLQLEEYKKAGEVELAEIASRQFEKLLKASVVFAQKNPVSLQNVDAATALLSYNQNRTGHYLTRRVVKSESDALEKAIFNTIKNHESNPNHDEPLARATLRSRLRRTYPPRQVDEWLDSMIEDGVIFQYKIGEKRAKTVLSTRGRP